MSTRLASLATLVLLLAACGNSVAPTHQAVVTTSSPPSLSPAPPIGERCADYRAERRPYFGDLHVHTKYSEDANILFGNTLLGPRDAYAFAQGGPVQLPTPDGTDWMDYKLERPLNFSTVTDHSEYFADGVVFGAPPTSSIWVDTQAAAAENYAPCQFTTFNAYEWTAQPNGANLHRNVIFRNTNVITPVDANATNNDVTRLWAQLKSRCLQAGTGCDVMAIPHNSNVSNGLMFTDPSSADEARDRQFFEPVAEITQHKGASECRFQTKLGMGVSTADELCDFELEPGTILNSAQDTPPSMSPPPSAFSRRSFLRSVLQDGLQLEQKGSAEADGSISHINPFKLGFIGSGDGHNSTPGATEEYDWHGHHAHTDGTSVLRLSPTFVSNNPGGLAVVWAEQNTRDSIFDAVRRRETYGTSGTRPIVRFFGGWGLQASLCDDPQLVQKAYAQGVPMGGDLPARPSGAGAPSFLAWVQQDAGTAAHPGNALQRLQVIKGWVDAGGKTHEQVYDIAPVQPSSDTAVDPNTCRAAKPGASELCTVWTDPAFSASESATYYLRVLEDPSCRWSVYDCRAVGIDPFAANCTAQPGTNAFPECCGANINPVIQERAWASPIWYRPGG